MKKIISFILCLSLIISMMPFFSLHIFAEEIEEKLPKFVYPTSSYSTFAETGIPYDAILDCFPETIEVKYENGAAYMKNIGGDTAQYIDHLNYQGHDGELVDGYWRFDVSREAYNAGGLVSIYKDSQAWHVQYKMSGERSIITLTSNTEGFTKRVSLYPVTGYGEQFVQVSYELYAGIAVTDSYEAGFLYEQTVALHEKDASIWAEYDSQGQVQVIDVFLYDTGKYTSLLPGKGWSEHNREYIPTKAPAGFENATPESLTKMLPTNIGCAHQWSNPLCDVPSICSLCKRQKGDPLGHKWVSGSEHDTCSTCNGILYRLPNIDIPTFEDRPVYSLDEVGLHVDAITSKFIPKINIKYENGIFMVPNIDKYRFRAFLPTDGYLRHKTENGWNLIEVSEEDLGKLELLFSADDDHLDYDFIYSHDGHLTSFEFEEEEIDKAIFFLFEEDIVEISYPKDKESSIKYIDTYKNGILTSQTVYDMDTKSRVYYNSELAVEKVRISIENKNFYLIPDKGWFLDKNGDEAVPTPEGYEDKDATYFAATYPHNIDFCIHSFEAQKCTKCGETIAADPDDNSNSTVMILIAGGVVLVVAAAVVVIVVVRKKKTA